MTGLPVAEAATEIGNADVQVTENATDLVVRDVSSDRYTSIAVQSTAFVASLLVKPIENVKATAVVVSIVYITGRVAVKLLATAPRSENNNQYDNTFTYTFLPRQ